MYFLKLFQLLGGVCFSGQKSHTSTIILDALTPQANLVETICFKMYQVNKMSLKQQILRHGNEKMQNCSITKESISGRKTLMHAATIGFICLLLCWQHCNNIDDVQYYIIFFPPVYYIWKKTQETAEEENAFHRNREKFMSELMKTVFHSKLKWFAPSGTS